MSGLCWLWHHSHMLVIKGRWHIYHSAYHSLAKIPHVCHTFRRKLSLKDRCVTRAWDKHFFRRKFTKLARIIYMILVNFVNLLIKSRCQFVCVDGSCACHIYIYDCFAVWGLEHVVQFCTCWIFTLNHTEWFLATMLAPAWPTGASTHWHFTSG